MAAPKEHEDIFESLSNGGKNSADFFNRLTGRWPWDLLEREYWPPRWTNRLVELLANLANIRQRRSLDVRDPDGFADFRASVVKQMKLRAAKRSRPYREPILTSGDIDRAKEELLGLKTGSLIRRQNGGGLTRRRADKISLGWENSKDTEWETGQEQERQSIRDDTVYDVLDEQTTENGSFLALSSTDSVAHNPSVPPSLVQHVLEDPIDRTQGPFCAALTAVAQEAGQRQLQVAMSLQQSQKALHDVQSQLGDSHQGPALHYDQDVERAESELAAATNKAELAQATLQHLQSWFVPAGDDQRSLIDKLAAEAAPAQREKQAAAVKLREAKLRRDMYHNGSAGLREQEREMTNLVEQLHREHDALVREADAVRIFLSVVELGPHRFHHMIHSSGMAPEIEASLRRVTRETSSVEEEDVIDPALRGTGGG